MSFTASLDDIVKENRSGLLGTANHWERVRLSEVADILNGYPFSSSLFAPDRGVPLLRIRDVGRTETQATYRGEFEDEYLVKPGELVIGMDGDFRCAIWRGPPAVLNQRVCKVTPRGEDYSLRFLAYVLQPYLDAIHAHTSSITVKHLSSRTVAEIPLPLPPPSEQARIVEALDATFTRLDAAASAFRRLQTSLERYRASVLEAACKGRLVPTEAELARREGRSYEAADVTLARLLTERRARWEIEEVSKLKTKGKIPANDRWKKKYKEAAGPHSRGLDLPEGWTWASVGQLGKAVTGTTPQKSVPENYGDALPFFKPTDLDAGYAVHDAREFLSEVGAKRARVLPAGSVLVTCIGATIGKTGFARRECATNQQINAVSPTTPDFMMQYLYWFFVSPGGQREIKQNASATTLPILNKSKFAAIPVPIPPLPEQNRIVAEIERQVSVLDALNATVDAVLTRSRTLRRSVLKGALEGRLVSPGSPQRPESARRECARAESTSRASNADYLKQAEPAMEQ